MRRLAALVFALLATAAGAQPASPLRVCADADDLPHAHRNGTGFENRIAELVAADLAMPLRYVWSAGPRGSVTDSAEARTCDLVVGVPADSPRTLNTRPYYRSSYVLVDKGGGQPVQDVHDPRLRQWRIGVPMLGDDIASSAPGHALVQIGGGAGVVGFPLGGEQSAAARMVRAITRGELDAAFVWGPQAGYYVRQAQLQGQPPLRMQMVAAPAPLATRPFESEIAMGVRPGNVALRDRLDELLVRRRADIERILANYGVPLLELEER